MNAITSLQHTKLQSAIPAAIGVANKASPMLQTKPTELMNMRRAIYDVLMEAEEMVFPSEMRDHLQIFGYSPQGVENEMRDMYKAGMLIRNKLRPYAYKLTKDCPVPGKELMKVRCCTKSASVAPAPVLDPNKALSTMAKLNSHIESMTTGGKIREIQYGYLGADIDLITNHFSKLKLECLKANSVDPEVAEQYGLVGENLDQMIDHLKQMEQHILQIAILAKAIRRNPL